jgi:hypothetical protein
MMSLLADVNIWQQTSVSALTQKEAVDAYNNEVLILYDICSKIAECIETDTGVQKAIQDKAANGFGPNTVINNTQYSQNVFISGTDGDANGCSNDAKFGRIVALVEYIDEVMQDFFQALDAATNIISQADEVISAIPLFETLPIDELVGLIGDTGEFWRDSYDASVNTQLLELIECQMWCRTRADCDVTIGDVRALIEERYDLTSTQGQLNVLSGTALIARIAATIAGAGVGTYIGDDFVYLSWLLQIAAIEATGTFFGVDPIDYNREASQGTPNTGWTQCNCAQTCIDYDFTVSQQGWLAVGPGQPVSSSVVRAAYATNTGWGVAGGPNQLNADDIIIFIANPFQVVGSATIEFSGINPNSGCCAQLRVGDENNQGNYTGGLQGTSSITLSNLNITGNYVRVDMIAENQNNQPMAGHITSVTLCPA